MPVFLEVALVGLVTVAAVYDLRYRRIPNWLSLSGVVIGLGCNTLLAGSHGLRESVLGLLCALVVYVPLYVVRGMGAGDVKLMAAVGAITGPLHWIEIFVATALIGGVVSLVVIATKGRFRQTLGNVAVIGTELLHLRAPAAADPRLDFRHREALRLPHGAAIASGSIVFLILQATQQA